MNLANRLLARYLGAVQRLLAVLGGALLDLLSVARCAACNQHLRGPAVFCPVCVTSVVRATPPHRTMVPGDYPGRGPAHDGIVVVGFAQYGGTVADALQRFKYGDRPDLARPLGALLRRAVRETNRASPGSAPPLSGDLVVPVPLHPRRLAERGFNQAGLLAREVQKELGAPLATSILLRQVDTPPQAKLGRAARAQNLAGAFRVIHRERLRRCRVILVDDVATTGATLAACADALRDAGVASVTALVVAIADH
ncbi:MAG: ComF family protein [Deltaproteobacteria bacterium]|nr:ComF family protein [Deltaproteobacteria bacterium]